MLRAPDADTRRRETERFIDDLRLVARRLRTMTSLAPALLLSMPQLLDPNFCAHGHPALQAQRGRRVRAGAESAAGDHGDGDGASRSAGVDRTGNWTSGSAVRSSRSGAGFWSVAGRNTRRCPVPRRSPTGCTLHIAQPSAAAARTRPACQRAARRRLLGLGAGSARNGAGRVVLADERCRSRIWCSTRRPSRCGRKRSAASARIRRR